jgi:hypothetical protein
LQGLELFPTQAQLSTYVEQPLFNLEMAFV